MNFLELYQRHEYFKDLMRSCLVYAKRDDIYHCDSSLAEFRGAISFYSYELSWSEAKAVHECFMRFCHVIWDLEMKRKI